ncbi:hypothetical protein EVAR_100112_1 [Eumeta japonica]|uniref:Uncharacterized protein n=1 Tax=Eumeta variegata TaxID=151549 RepID=A0A4C1YWW5_EUMVA|nr:hypothetical protein EVAR_100112_1 [Eumeta japonica]
MSSFSFLVQRAEHEAPEKSVSIGLSLNSIRSLGSQMCQYQRIYELVHVTYKENVNSLNLQFALSHPQCAYFLSPTLFAPSPTRLSGARPCAARAPVIAAVPSVNRTKGFVLSLRSFLVPNYRGRAGVTWLTVYWYAVRVLLDTPHTPPPGRTTVMSLERARNLVTEFGTTFFDF